MTEYYDVWISWMRMRDQALVSQASFAVSLVLAYRLRWLLPAALREPLRRLYLVGGIPLYVFTLGLGLLDLELSPATSAGLVALALPAALAFVAWQFFASRREGDYGRRSAKAN